MNDLNKNIGTSKGLVVLAALLIVGGGIYWNYLNNNPTSTSDFLPSTTPVSTTAPQPIVGQIVLGKTSESTDDAGYKHIFVDVTNNGELKNGVSLTATLYDANDVVIGNVPGVVMNIGKGETKTADILIHDSSHKNYAKFKVGINGSY